MMTNETRPCFTTQHQTYKTKTKTKTDFLVSDRSCPQTAGLRPHHWLLRVITLINWAEKCSNFSVCFILHVIATPTASSWKNRPNYCCCNLFTDERTDALRRICVVPVISESATYCASCCSCCCDSYETHYSEMIKYDTRTDHRRQSAVETHVRVCVAYSGAQTATRSARRTDALEFFNGALTTPLPTYYLFYGSSPRDISLRVVCVLGSGAAWRLTAWQRQTATFWSTSGIISTVYSKPVMWSRISFLWQLASRQQQAVLVL